MLPCSPWLKSPGKGDCLCQTVENRSYVAGSTLYEQVIDDGGFSSERLCNDTVSVRLSVPSIDSSNDVQLVNCCRPKRGRQIPIDSCRVPVIGRCLPPAPELWCGQRRCCDPRMIDAGLFIRRRLANSIFVVWPCCLCVGVTMPVWLIHRINNKQTTDLRFWLITTSLTNYCIIVPWLKCDCYIDCYFVQVCWTCRQTLLWVD